MDCQRPLDLERYRKMKEKIKMAPKAAVVASAPSTEATRLSPDPAHQRAMMPVASAYREAPPTPQLTGRFSCGGLLGGGSQTTLQLPPSQPEAREPQQTTSRQHQLTVSLFDEAKRQRYERLRSRYQKTESPHNGESDKAESRSQNETRETPPSQPPGRKHSPFGRPKVGTRAQDEANSSGRSSAVSPSKRSAFSALTTNQPPRRFSALDSHAGHDKYSDLPAPPSFAQSLSSHPLNRNGLPIASPTHDPEQKSAKEPEGGRRYQPSEPRPAHGGTRSYNGPASASKKLPPSVPPAPELRRSQTPRKEKPSTQTKGMSKGAVQKRSLSVPRLHASRPIEREQTPKHPRNVQKESTRDGKIPDRDLVPTTSQQRKGILKETEYSTRVAKEKRAISAPRTRQSTPVKLPERPQSTRNQNTKHEQASSTEKPHSVFHADNRHRQMSTSSQATNGSKMLLNPRFVSKPPPLITTSSSERGVTPPPEAIVPQQQTPRSVDTSLGSSSTAKRDRILESRGIAVETGQLNEPREPLNEIRTTRKEDFGNGYNGSPAPSLYPRPSLEIPSLKSHYSNDTRSANTNRDENRHGGGSTPVDFYRQLTAAKAKQAAMVKQRTESQSSSQLGERQVNTPRQMYRSESPRERNPPQLDQRTVRLLYSSNFSKMIEDHALYETGKLVRNYEDRKMQSMPKTRSGVSVIVRKRPLLNDEVAGGDFDVVNAEPGRPNSIVVYQTSLMPDLKTKNIKASVHEFDHVFAEHQTAEDLYIRVGQPAVLNAREGGASAFIIFGGHHSGKSHNLADLTERAGFDLFESPHSNSGARRASVAVQYLELSNTHVTDLLGPIGSFVRIVDEGGCFRLKGSVAKSATSPEALLAIFSDANRRLTRTASVRNRAEGETYIFCQIAVQRENCHGTLTLLECPSIDFIDEHEGKSMFNMLLESLKAKAQGAHKNPFRAANNLTKVLQECLEDPKSKFSLLATISPAATSTETTLSVLEVAGILKEVDAGRLGHTPADGHIGEHEDVSPRSCCSESELVLPRQWNHEELVSWMRRKNLMGNPVPPDVNGRFAMRMSKRQLKNTFYDVADTEMAEKLFMALRAENDRVARMRVKLRMARDRQVISRP